MIVSVIPSELLDRCLNDLMPLLKKASATSDGRAEVVDLVDDILKKNQILWVCFEDKPIKYFAVCTTKVVQYPRRKMISGVYVAGDEIDLWRDKLLDTLERFAKDEGCDGIEMVGRLGWSRKLKDRGWRTDASVYQYDMRH